MKNNKLFTKVIAATAIAAVTITTVTVASPKNVHAAEERILADEFATAYINADGSGYIELRKNFTTKDRLTQIGGVPLKDIITFNDGGYIDTYYTFEDKDNYMGDAGDFLSAFWPHLATVHGAGPSGFFSGSGHLHFTDESGDTYNLSIWRHEEKWHSVSYGSDQPLITKISWNS